MPVLYVDRAGNAMNTVLRCPSKLPFLSVTAILVALMFQTVVAQKTGNPARELDSAPSLQDTIAFMNRSVHPEGGFVTEVKDSCELYLTRNKQYRFGLAVSSYVKSTDQFGIAHYGIKWNIYEEEPRVVRFNLADIDPSSIQSKRVPSAEFIASHDLDEHPQEANDPDLVVVNYVGTDSKMAIDIGHIEQKQNGASAEPVFETKRALDFLVFESQDRGERFVTAFVHAVRLCGGRGTAFPPTPSKP
jgi:hypothetical protein